MPKPNPTPKRPAHRPRNPGYNVNVKIQFADKAEHDHCLTWLRDTRKRGKILSAAARAEEWTDREIDFRK